jgi:catechol 2,3-dioxygenase-like lactoylglutathione lyase family enzyme
MSSPAFRGLYTAIYSVPDLPRAKEWYRSVLGIEPYFDEPFYVGFNVGGCELGLDPDIEANRPGAGGGVAYWGVADADAAFSLLRASGAKERSPVREVGGGIKVAVVEDPFGNLVGIIENPHFGRAPTG